MTSHSQKITFFVVNIRCSFLGQNASLKSMKIWQGLHQTGPYVNPSIAYEKLTWYYPKTGTGSTSLTCYTLPNWMRFIFKVRCASPSLQDHTRDPHDSRWCYEYCYLPQCSLLHLTPCAPLTTSLEPVSSSLPKWQFSKAQNLKYGLAVEDPKASKNCPYGISKEPQEMEIMVTSASFTS